MNLLRTSYLLYKLSRSILDSFPTGRPNLFARFSFLFFSFWNRYNMLYTYAIAMKKHQNVINFIQFNKVPFSMRHNSYKDVFKIAVIQWNSPAISFAMGSVCTYCSPVLQLGHIYMYITHHYIPEVVFNTTCQLHYFLLI